MIVEHEVLPANPDIAQIFEQCNELPYLKLQYRPGQVVGRGFVGSEISFDDQGSRLFSGVVTRVDTRVGEVVAHPNHIVQDLAHRSLGIFACASEPSTVRDLNGFQDRFSWVTWGEHGRLKVGCICQYQETDWDLARRAAALEGGYLVVNLCDGKTKALNRHNEKSHVVTLADFATGSHYRIESLTHATTKHSEWNLRDGIFANARSNLPVETAAETSAQQFLGQFAIADNEPTGLSIVESSQTQECADRDSRLLRGAIETWGARLLNRYEVAINDRIDLSDELGGGSFTVWRKVLTYAQGEKLLDVQCRPANAGYPELLDIIRKPKHPIVVFGKVTNSNDPLRTGRVRVRLADHSEEQAIWCHTIQPHLGVCQVPSPGEQVAIFIEPNTTSLPICLGSVFSTAHKVPEPVKDPAKEKLIFELPNAIHLLAQADEGTVELRSSQIRLRISPQGVKVSRG